MDKLEISIKNKVLDDKKSKGSPHTSRKHVENDQEGGVASSRPPKRYSNSRQQPRSNNPQRHNKQDYHNGSSRQATPTSGGSNFVNANFPTNASGPPPAAPFLPSGAAVQVGATPTSNSGFLDPAAMVNYGPPPPVQFAPVPVPVTVTVPLVTAHHDALPVLATPLGNPNVTAPDQVLLAAAAAAQAQGQGYAEVRGGVTYFNPTAQAPVMPRPQVNKRPKAAIPIVDPSQVQYISNQSSTEEATPTLDEATPLSSVEDSATVAAT